MSEDSDLLCYGVGVLLCKFEPGMGSVTCVELDKLIGTSRSPPAACV